MITSRAASRVDRAPRPRRRPRLPTVPVPRRPRARRARAPASSPASSRGARRGGRARPRPRDVDRGSRSTATRRRSSSTSTRTCSSGSGPRERARALLAGLVGAGRRPRRSGRQTAGLDPAAADDVERGDDRERRPRSTPPRPGAVCASAVGGKSTIPTASIWMNAFHFPSCCARAARSPAGPRASGRPTRRPRVPP